MIRIETVLLANWGKQRRDDWMKPERMVPLDRATVPAGAAAKGNIPGAVLFEMSGTTIFDHTYDTNVLLWWGFFLGVLEDLSKAPKAEEFMHFPDQPLKMRMRRAGGRVICSLDYRNSRTEQRVRVGASGSFDELLRKSLDEAERFYLKVAGSESGDAGSDPNIVEPYTTALRRRLGVSRWTEPDWMHPDGWGHQPG